MSTPTRTPNPATVTRPQRSSRRVSRKSPIGWLPWALLGLLALLVALVLLAINAVDDDGPDGPAGDSIGQINSNGSGINGADGNGAPAGAETGVGTGGTGSGGEGSGGAGTGAAGGSGGAGTGAALSAGGRNVLAASGGSLAGLINQPANGTARVESVVSDEGFWVGQSRTNRVFVYLTPEARRSNGESGFQVRAGQSIRLVGEVVRPISEQVSGVTDAEGRGQLNRQSALIAATSVVLAS